jgi:hypothetical protein
MQGQHARDSMRAADDDAGALLSDPAAFARKRVAALRHVPVSDHERFGSTIDLL